MSGKGKGAKSGAPAKKGAEGGVKKPSQAWKPRNQVRQRGYYKNLFVARPKDFSVGNNLQPKRDLRRFVKWPLYIRRQRRKALLKKRIKIPPPINQFNYTLDKQSSKVLFKILDAHKPKTRKEKRQARYAAAKEGGQQKPQEAVIQFGLHHVFSLVEQKKAKLVVIAHDVDPIELVLTLPTLCHKKGVPYCIVKGKARLGDFVGMKTATCVALKDVTPKFQAQLKQLVDHCKEEYNDKYAEVHMKKVGGGIPSKKRQAKLDEEKRERERQKLKEAGMA